MKIPKIVANNPEQEEAQEDMEVNYKGEALEIGFNVSYLLDVFNTLEQRDIKMTLLNSNSSVLIESVSDESALMLSCRCVCKVKGIILAI